MDDSVTNPMSRTTPRRREERMRWMVVFSGVRGVRRYSDGGEMMTRRNISTTVSLYSLKIGCPLRITCDSKTGSGPIAITGLRRLESGPIATTGLKIMESGLMYKASNFSVTAGLQCLTLCQKPH
jgi:hypothetical protein